MMRISKDPDDKAFSPTAGERKVWHNDREVPNWITADEFRRVIVTPEKVLNGAVRIERLAEDGAPPEPDLILEFPASAGFAGAGLVHEKPTQEKPEHPEHPEHPEAPEQSQKPTEIDRPGSPAEEVVVQPSERLPDEGITSV